MEPRINSDQDQSPNTNTNYALMSEAEREAEFRRQHQQYIAEKIARKKQLLALRRAESSSSSDESDDDGPQRSSSSSSNEKQKQRRKYDQKQTGRVQNFKLESKKSQDMPQSQKFGVYSLKKGGQWVKDVLQFQGDSLTILNIPYDLKIFNKIKIISQMTQGCPYRIKLSYQKSQLLFSPVANSEQRHGLSASYYIFAKVIQQKLVQSGMKLRQRKEEKVVGAPQSITNNSLISGKIYKKSQLFGKWDQRFVVINKDGLFSYKKFNQKHTVHFAAGSIQQMWTRFALQDQMLVVKVMHQGKKTQFAFPITEIVCKNCWIYYFFTIMSGSKK